MLMQAYFFLFREVIYHSNGVQKDHTVKHDINHMIRFADRYIFVYISWLHLQSIEKNQSHLQM